MDCVRESVGGKDLGWKVHGTDDHESQQQHEEGETERDRAVQESASSEEDAEGQKVARDRINGR